MANRISIKKRQVFFNVIHPILTWEYHCFGYRKAGYDSYTTVVGKEKTTKYNEYSDEYMTTEKPITRTKGYAFFSRHEEYPQNPLFFILEILMTIVSLARVYTAKFLIPAYFIMDYLIEEGYLRYSKYSDDMLPTEIISIVLIAMYVCTFVIPLAGYIVRKAFGLDQRMDDICEENGWMKWSEYQDE